ncbi:MAG: hypothetical protein QF902_08625, partial [Rhodospirillales bacterium]|nr:hypothetical protein [Rhodospirillales bacterium]
MRIPLRAIVWAAAAVLLLASAWLAWSEPVVPFRPQCWESGGVVGSEHQIWRDSQHTSFVAALTD